MERLNHWRIVFFDDDVFLFLLAPVNGKPMNDLPLLKAEAQKPRRILSHAYQAAFRLWPNRGDNDTNSIRATNGILIWD